MQKFKVKCFEGGIWDEAGPSDIEAQNEREAAETVCGGEHLVERGKRGQLRAQVWLPASPGEKKLFYVPAQPI